MIVAITGATGFIGRRLTQRLLARKDEVRVLSRQPDRIAALLPGAMPCYGDLGRPEMAALEHFVRDADLVYHCAAEVRDETLMMAVNAHGTGALARAAQGRIGAWVQLSSVGVYGARLSALVSESDPLNAITPYERSKAAGDGCVVAQAETGGFPCTILRPSTVIGEDMPADWLRQLARAIERGWFFFIGSPGVSANYISVEDVIEALLACGRQSAGRQPVRVFNLSNWATMEAVVGAIADVLDCSQPRLRLPERLVRATAALTEWTGRSPLTASRIDALTSRVRYSSDAIKNELGCRPHESLEDSVRAIVGAWKVEEPK